MNVEDIEQPVEQDGSRDSLAAKSQPRETQDERTVPLAALEDERRKRQQLEESLNETRGKMTELESLRDEIKQWRESQVYR